ncbi:MAG: single-stranded DNA-binding protein [Candidatus Melainabacteria bacterium]
MNSVVILGRLGQDPELKYFESGSVKAKFSVAVDRNFSKENKITDWFNIEVWGRTAEFVGEWVKKGTQVIVTGQLDVNQYNDQAGNPKEWLSIKASDVRFAGGKRDNAGGGDMMSQPAY